MPGNEQPSAALASGADFFSAALFAGRGDNRFSKRWHWSIECLAYQRCICLYSASIYNCIAFVRCSKTPNCVKPLCVRKKWCRHMDWSHWEYPLTFGEFPCGKPPLQSWFQILIFWICSGFSLWCDVMLDSVGTVYDHISFLT